MPPHNRLWATAGCGALSTLGLACPAHYVWATTYWQRRWGLRRVRAEAVSGIPYGCSLVANTAPPFYRGRLEATSGSEHSLHATLLCRGVRGRRTDSWATTKHL